MCALAAALLAPVALADAPGPMVPDVDVVVVAEKVVVKSPMTSTVLRPFAPMEIGTSPTVMA